MISGDAAWLTIETLTRGELVGAGPTSEYRPLDFWASTWSGGVLLLSLAPRADALVVQAVRPPADRWTISGSCMFPVPSSRDMRFGAGFGVRPLTRLTQHSSRLTVGVAAVDVREIVVRSSDGSWTKPVTAERLFLVGVTEDQPITYVEGLGADGARFEASEILL